MRITRYPSITEQQFMGCTSAFVDSLAGELNAATIALRRLAGLRKGAAFAYEMTLDTHRYGALIVLDRWASLGRAFGPHLQLSQRQSILDEAVARATAAEEILNKANLLLDAGERYDDERVEVCVLAFQAVNTVFREERDAAAQAATLGPMLPEEYKEARQIFREDLAVR